MGKMKFVIAMSCALAMIVGANSETNVIERIRNNQFKDPRVLFETNADFDFDKMADEDDNKTENKKVNTFDFDKMADEDDKKTETKKDNEFDFDKMADEDDKKTETKKVNEFDFDKMADEDDSKSLKFLSS